MGSRLSGGGMDTRGLSRLLLPSSPSLLLLSRSPQGAVGAPDEDLLSQPTSNFVNTEPSKFLDGDVKNDLASYIENAVLLSPDTYNYFLSLPEKLASNYLNASSERVTSEKDRELVLIGTAGYILSFLPKSVFKTITDLVPL